jgi:tRNA nucleotidyltransferase/poly(A) polymerase
MNLKEQLDKLPFKKEVELLGGKIYAVGGAVRDEILGIRSKDLDILIRKIPLVKLVEILSGYGKVDQVGESFGVIKFKATGSTETIDIALPRTETSTGDTHKSFIIVSDPELAIEEDLYRRDFTINAMAMDTHGDIIDPYHGLKAIADKEINLVNPQAFRDDPLRIIRAIQFACRFNFSIGKTTELQIINNRAKVANISGERILMEFEKIVTKGNPNISAKLIKKFDLDTILFPEWTYHFNKDTYINEKAVHTLAELLCMYSGFSSNTIIEAKNRFKADTATLKEIKGLIGIRYQYFYNTHTHTRRVKFFQIFDDCPKVMHTKLFDSSWPHITRDLKDFRDGKYPKCLAEILVYKVLLYEKLIKLL